MNNQRPFFFPNSGDLFLVKISIFNGYLYILHSVPKVKYIMFLKYLLFV